MTVDAIAQNDESILHIAMLIPTLDRIGGAERQVIHLAIELARRGHRITLIALSGLGSAHSGFLESADVTYISLRMRKAWVDPRGWRTYLRWIRENRPDIVHAHLPHSSWFARWVRLLAPVQVVIDTIHTSRTATPSKRFGYRLTKWLSDYTTCVSRSVAEVALNAHLVTEEKSSVVFNGVVTTERLNNRCPAAPVSTCANRRPFVWIACGRLEPVKDYPTLLKAFARLVGGPRLKVVGAGSALDSLKQLARELSIEGRVEFIGFHENVQPLLEAADAFVLTSLWEGLPIGLLEAQAACLPVVATDGSGVSEAMIDGKTGFLAQVGNVETLSTAMLRMMNLSPDRRQEIGECGRAFVRENFHLTDIADQWEHLYDRLLNLHPKCRRWSRSVHLLAL